MKQIRLHMASAAGLVWAFPRTPVGMDPCLAIEA